MATKKVGDLIKEARTGAGLTQAELAKKVDGVTASDISKAERGEKLPGIYIACGTEDMLCSLNKAFSAFLTEQGVAHEAHFTPGEHNWKFWDPYLQKSLPWLLEE